MNSIEDEAKFGKPMDDEEGWITPDNIHKFSNDFANIEEDEDIDRQRVSVMTTDFAMQNVLLQMGILLLSVNGLRIKRVKQWVLECSGCLKVTNDIQKKFCPSCGNPSLRRLSIRVHDNGDVTYYRGFKKPNVRGTQYSIPLPKSGRSNQQPLVAYTEEEYEKYQRRYGGRKKKEVIDEYDMDNIFSGKRSGGKAQIHVMKTTRNPNEVKKQSRKKR